MTTGLFGSLAPDGKGVALFERGVELSFCKTLTRPDSNRNGAAIVKILKVKTRRGQSLPTEKIPASNAEIVAVWRVIVKGSRTLAQDQTGNASAVVQRKIVKLENGIGVQEGHRAIFEFDFCPATITGREHIALTNGQIERSGFPQGFGVGDGLVVKFTSIANIALDQAETNDANMAGIGRCQERQCSRKKKKSGKRKKESTLHRVTLDGTAS